MKPKGNKNEDPVEMTDRMMPTERNMEAVLAAETDWMLRAAAFLGLSGGMYLGAETIATADASGMGTIMSLTHSLGAVYLILVSGFFLLLGHAALVKCMTLMRTRRHFGNSLDDRQLGRFGLYSALLIAPLVWITIFAVGWPWTQGT